MSIKISKGGSGRSGGRGRGGGGSGIGSGSGRGGLGNGIGSGDLIFGGGAGSGDSGASRPAVQGEGPNSLLSCEALSCPAQCSIKGQKIQRVGFAPIPGLSANLTGLSWTVGTTQQTETSILEDPPVSVTKTFFLGSNPKKSLEGVGSCAIFFANVTAEAHFGKRTDTFLGDPVDTLSDEGGELGPCEKALSTDCVQALINRAMAFNLAGASGETACTNLQSHFEANLDPACAKFAGTKWNRVLSSSMIGPGAPAPMTQAPNECWPTDPQTNTLSVAQNLTISAGSTNRVVLDNQFAITPILTLFYPRNGTAIRTPEAHMTCIKPRVGTRQSIVDESPPPSGGTGGGTSGLVGGGASGHDGRGLPSLKSVLAISSFIALSALCV